jgi:hypothetical protein
VVACRSDARGGTALAVDAHRGAGGTGCRQPAFPTDRPGDGARCARLRSARRAQGQPQLDAVRAACRAREEGIRDDIAATVLGRAALANGLDPAEIQATIVSAWNRSRVPA